MSQLHADPRADRGYYRHRESQERAAADATRDPAAKRVHLELAQSYAERVEELPVA